ncbi:MAG: hypothetical protein A4E52_01714 [Pelotomaculum sp. PtaB.Bin013]|nr:MAG: hypothetical protein A4E52_01714 [Pelotomaculum sp. PtaB.Bin013]
MEQEGPFKFCSDCFGHEKKIDRKGLMSFRKVIEEILVDNKRKYPADVSRFAINSRTNILKTLENSNAIASDYRPLNDSLLYDHSVSTSTIFKVLLNQWILGKRVKSFESFRKKCQDELAILIIIFDLKELFGQVEKIGDLLGRKRSLKKIQDILKKKLEFEYAAGNEIYREPGLSSFLLPSQFAEDDGRKEIISILDGLLQKCCCDNNLLVPYNFEFRKTLRIFNEFPGILSQFRYANLPANSRHADCISKHWEEASGQIEVCPLCGILPRDVKKNRQYNGKLCAACGKLRENGQVARRHEPGSIWMDEVADPDTNRLAVLSIEIPLERWLDEKGMLYLHQFKLKDGQDKNKTLSYERVRRLWSVTEDYISQLTGLIEKELGTCERLKLEIKPVEGFPALERGQFYLLEKPEPAELYLNKNGTFITVTRIKNKSFWREGITLNLRADRPGTPCFKADVEKVDLELYYPFTKVYRSKNILMLLVPAREARRLAVEALGCFEKRFPKALGKLPLSIGIAWAPAKYPLSLLLQAALNMQRYLRERSNLPQYAKVVEEPEKTGGIVKLELQIDGMPEDKVKFEFNLMLGNNETGLMDKPDIFYVNLPVEKCTIHKKQTVVGEVTLQDKEKCAVVPAGQLVKGNKLKILTGAMDFEFLDSTARRFDLRLADDGRRMRQNPGTRPLNVFHLKVMEKLERIFKRQPDLTDTHLRNVQILLITKYKEWCLEDCQKDSRLWLTYEGLVDAVINKEFDLPFKDLNFLKRSVLSGLFFDWFELFYQIEKRKIREGM